MFYLDIWMMLAISPSINDPRDLKTTVPVPFLTTVLPEGQCEMSSAFIIIFLQKSDDMLREDNVTSLTAEKSVGEADLALDKTFKCFFVFFLQLALLFPCEDLIDLIPCYVNCYKKVCG